MTDLSILILTLNSKSYLRDCLNSIRAFPPAATYEIWVADNGSNDGTVEMLEAQYPEARIIRNTSNLGFTKPTNQLLNAANGEFLLLLNPDTLLTEDCFTPQLDFLKENPQVGISIPKVLNKDGTFQKQCRRGEARPIEVIGYILGLGQLFPNNRKLNGYLQSWLPKDQVAEVMAVSGSCMFIRRKTWEAVGLFDERFFAYQEDSDYCMRAREAGWKVMYVPLSQIIHYGGKGGSGTQPWKKIKHWHLSYFNYYRKHFAKDHCCLFNLGFYLLMLGKYLLALLWNAIKMIFGWVISPFRQKK